MSDHNQKDAGQSSAPRNPFSGTGIIVQGIVRTFASTQGKNGKLYHDLYLTTGANPDLKISLLNPPDPLKFQIGSMVKMVVRLASWKSEKGSGIMLVEVAA